MKINQLSLINFRNYKKLLLQTPAFVNIFYGKNAQGKTNLLEAIFYGAFGSSHRTTNEDDLVNFQEQGLAVSLAFSKQEEEHNLRIKRYLTEGRKKKELLLDEKKTTAKQHYGFLNVVMFSPEDLQLVKGEPALRRRFLDMEIAQTDPIYYELLVHYNKVLRQRNKLLKDIGEKGAPVNLLEVWNQELSRLAAQILTKRLLNLQQLQQLCQAIFRVLTKEKENLTLTYELKANDGQTLVPELKTPTAWEAFYLTQLQQRVQKDLWRGSTGIGMHRDDLLLHINGHNVKAFGSQGQQRSCALALKLAQIEYVRQEIGDFPILLLDDVMSELDNTRREQLLHFIDGRVQTFITVNDKSLIPSLPANAYFEVQDGIISEDSHG